ncbi:MAG: hypothetical protein R6U32_05770 [Candidatus Woesearchaeota archaeon]
MALHHLLKDRAAVRLLKTMYDHEAMNKGSYTMKLSEAKKKLGLAADAKEQAMLLSSHGLAGIDKVNGDYIMSITNKGKEFIEVFDQLVELFRPKESAGAKKVSIKYELTAQEKRIMVMAYRISREIGRDFVAMKTLVEELYPNKGNKTSTVSRYISRLEELNLMERQRQGRHTYVKVTESGFKMIKEQYLKGLMH